MSKKAPVFSLRLPSDLQKWLTELAEESTRSLNTQIVHMLGQHCRVCLAYADGKIHLAHTRFALCKACKCCPECCDCGITKE
jgi:hypothetical protein